MNEKYRIKVLLLGCFELYFDNNSLITKLSNKACGLLCYLALNNDKYLSKDILAELFWDADYGETAKYNLRFTIWQIKKFFKDNYAFPDIICSNKSAYRLNPNVEIYSDVMEVKTLFCNGENSDEKYLFYEKIRTIYKGDFLENYEFNNCFKFNDWIFYEKEDLQYLYYKVLTSLASHYFESSDFHSAVELYRQALRTNPFIEELHVSLIKSYIASGDRNNALAQYKRCCTLLRDELNVEPMESTKEVYQEILAEQPSTESNKTVKKDVIYYYNDLPSFMVKYNQESQRRIMCTCIPLDSLSDYLIWCITDNLLDIFEDRELKKIPDHYWKDLCVYNARICEIFDIDESRTAVVNTIRSYSSLIFILNKLTTEEVLSIFINDVQLLDSNSKQFLHFLSANISKQGIRLYIYEANY